MQIKDTIFKAEGVKQQFSYKSYHIAHRNSLHSLTCDPKSSENKRITENNHSFHNLKYLKYEGRKAPWGVKMRSLGSGWVGISESANDYKKHESRRGYKLGKREEMKREQSKI